MVLDISIFRAPKLVMQNKTQLVFIIRGSAKVKISNGFFINPYFINLFCLVGEASGVEVNSLQLLLFPVLLCNQIVVCQAALVMMVIKHNCITYVNRFFHLSLFLSSILNLHYDA